MVLWRLVRRARARQALDGAGAAKWGGRWNLPGTRVVYTASTLALAALEQLVHFDYDLAPEGFVAIALSAPDDALAVEERGRLPARWRDYPAPWTLQRLGSEWAQSGASLLLSVPSAVIPSERNFLVNPAHPDFAKIRRMRPQPFAFDGRLVPRRREK
jgi:RES domain-containing protein